MHKVRVTTKEPLVVEWLLSNGKWFRSSNERLVQHFRESAEYTLMTTTARYATYADGKVRVSYWEPEN